MLRYALATLTVAASATSALAEAHAPSDEVITAIEAKLVVMKCQMDPDDIEVDGDGYELDDVICEGGQQMDIELDAELNETGRRLE